MRRAFLPLLIVLSLGVCLLSLLGQPAAPREEFSVSGRDASLPAPSLPRGSVSVNSADAEELMQLPGIGETMAREILTQREARGPFFYPEDLLSVRGIGPVRLEAIFPWINLD